MKKIFAFFILGTYAAVAMAAVTSEQRIKADKVVVGRPSPAADPLVEFQGTTQRIKANRTTGRMQFTNDGTNFKNIGSGSGGAGGVNLLTDDNGDFEAGDTAWTESGGTFSIETTNPLFGVGSGKWDSSASSQTLISNLKTIEKGMVGRTCLAEMVYKWPSGVAADLSFQVIDGSSNVILTNDLTPTTGDDVVKTQRNFDCGALGAQYRIRILSNVVNPAEIIVDNAFLGSDSNSVSVAQMALAGSSDFLGTATCTQTRTSTTFGPFTGSAACPGPTIISQKIGSWLTTDVDLPRQTINNLPAGTYVAEFTVASFMSSSATAGFAIHDGTTTCNGVQGETSAASGASTTVSCVFEYSGAGNRSFELYGASSAATINLSSLTVTPNLSTRFKLYRYPSSPAEAITLETSGSSWSGYHDATCNSWSRTNVSYGDFAADASCALVQRYNNGFGAVTTSGSVLPAIVFTPKVLGAYHFNVLVNDIDCGTTNAHYGVALYDGTNYLGDAVADCASGGVESNQLVISGIYNITSLAAVTLRLHGKSSTGTINITKNAYATAAIEWSIFPITQQMPAPVFTELQNIVKGGENDVKVVSAYITNAGTPALSRQTGAWVNSLTDNGVGDVTINTTTFTAAPQCTCVGQENIAAPNLTCQFQTLTSTAIRTKMAAGASGGALDRDIHIICVGK